LQEYRGLRAKTRDGWLVSKKSGVSLTILPHGGVSGSLGHRILDQRPRTNAANGRALTSGTRRSSTEGGGADKLGPATGACVRGKYERSDLRRAVGIRFGLIRSGPFDLRRTPGI
jgi:hypothetical protein